VKPPCFIAFLICLIPSSEASSDLDITKPQPSKNYFDIFKVTQKFSSVTIAQRIDRGLSGVEAHKISNKIAQVKQIAQSQSSRHIS
jgi:hypothetical protein